MEIYEAVKRFGSQVWEVARESANPLVIAGGFAAGSAMAQTTGTSYTAITGAVDYTSAAAAIVTVFGLVAVLYLAWKGGKMVLNAIKG